MLEPPLVEPRRGRARRRHDGRDDLVTPVVVIVADTRRIPKQGPHLLAQREQAIRVGARDLNIHDWRPGCRRPSPS